MLVTLLGIVIEVREEHLEKAEDPILVTLLGIVTDVKPEQCPNASYPILVTLLGMVMEVKRGGDLPNVSASVEQYR